MAIIIKAWKLYDVPTFDYIGFDHYKEECLRYTRNESRSIYNSITVRAYHEQNI